MDLAELLDSYKNGRTVRERRRVGDISVPPYRRGVIYGTALGGATKRGPNPNRLMLNVHVKWDDGTELTVHHSALEVLR